MMMTMTIINMTNRIVIDVAEPQATHTGTHTFTGTHRRRLMSVHANPSD